MIKKVEVRKRLALYENEIKEDIEMIREEIQKKDNACLTNEMKDIWRQSKEYARLNAKWQALTEVLMDIRDIRCDEMFEDEN